MKQTGMKVIGVYLLTGALAVSAIAAMGVFKSTVIGSTPGQTIGGVASAGAPWVVSEGQVKVEPNGRLKVEVEGLILPFLGTAGPVSHIAASLVCVNVSSTSVPKVPEVVATTGAVPLSPEGNAEIQENITLPSSCPGPVVLLRIAGVNGTLLGAPGPWIASTGF